jgi:hypothetical protein
MPTRWRLPCKMPLFSDLQSELSARKTLISSSKQERGVERHLYGFTISNRLCSPSAAFGYLGAGRFGNDGAARERYPAYYRCNRQDAKAPERACSSFRVGLRMSTHIFHLAIWRKPRVCPGRIMARSIGFHRSDFPYCMGIVRANRGPAKPMTMLPIYGGPGGPQIEIGCHGQEAYGSSLRPG